MDSSGVNAFASWAHDGMQTLVKEPARQPEGDLLVPLQHDRDTQIRMSYLSPMFYNMVGFLRFLADNVDTPMRVRDHPSHPCCEEARAVVEGCGRMSWDTSPTLESALDGAAALLTINSSCGVLALTREVPIVSFGRSVWTSVQGASYPMFGVKEPREALRSVISEIKSGRNSLNRIAQAAALGRILGKQWWPEQLPDRLGWALK